MPNSTALRAELPSPPRRFSWIELAFNVPQLRLRHLKGMIITIFKATLQPR